MPNSNSDTTLQDDYYANIKDNLSDSTKDEKGKKVSSIKLKIKKKLVDTEKNKDTVEKGDISLSQKKEDVLPKKDVIVDSKSKIKKVVRTISFENPTLENVPKKVEEKEKLEDIEEKKVEPKEEILKKEILSIDSEILHQKFGSGKKTFLDKKENRSGEGISNKFDQREKPKFFAQTNNQNKFPQENTGREDRFKKKFVNYKKTLKTKGYIEEEEEGFFRRSKKSIIGGDKQKKNVEEINQVLTDKTGQKVALKEFLTVKEFSEKIGIPLSKVIAEFVKNGMIVNINTKVDFDTFFIIAESFKISVIKEMQGDVSVTSIMDGNISELLKDDDPANKVERPAIVSIMGHVDHGKTSILDYIRKTSVAGEEAGGITQKIGAYQVEKDGKKITFLDTPGHEAFSLMRARGAKLTDIAVIVVAADEGIKPQTIESINHAKEAKVPIIVAINKMDKPGANPDFVKGQLAEQGLHPEDWGGNTIVVPVSAQSGFGIDTLLDMIILTTQLQELKADTKRLAVATVIESRLDAKLGSLATVLINTGTLNKGDAIVCNSAFGRVRSIKDFKGKNIESAGPSKPVLISGLNSVVEGGDILQVTSDIEIARSKAHEFNLLQASKSINDFEGASLEMLLNRIKSGNLKQLKIVLKADSNGSLEAVKEALLKLSTGEIKVQIIHNGVGDVNDSDVLMAGTSQALLVAYNVGTVGQAKNILMNSKIEYINKKVIYHILEKIEAIITGMIDIKHEDLDLGQAKIKAIFFTTKDKMILGLDIISGKIENRAKLKIIRNNKKAGSGEVLNLKSGVTDVHEMLEGTECGIAFSGDSKVEIGDILEIYKIVQRK